MNLRLTALYLLGIAGLVGGVAMIHYLHEPVAGALILVAAAIALSTATAVETAVRIYNDSQDSAGRNR
jgi:hypothetical protein